MDSIPYPLQYVRLRTREVAIGKLKIGGANPICIQSMLTSATTDVDGCVREIRSLHQVNCQLIRLTIPSKRDLDAIPEIRRRMKEEGIDTPLVADIHFSPKLAVDACEVFEKVRINPGNYSDTPRSSKSSLDGAYFEEGATRLQEAILPLVRSLKRYGTALRIGVNQGSLSSRMMEKYGDSPLGMVQSALEMVRFFEAENFRQIVVSLKSSNPLVVQKAYRLLAHLQSAENAVALHLGVTEAGNGVMGRIKSLAGIGPLLQDGIGDTIRVSLTEPSAHEIVFAREMLRGLGAVSPRLDAKEMPWFREITHQRVANSTVILGTEQVLGGGQQVKIGKALGTQLPETDIPFETDFTYSSRGTDIFLDSLPKPVCRLRDPAGLTSVSDLSSYSALLVEIDNPRAFLRAYYQKTTGKSSLPVGLLYHAATAGTDYVRDVSLAAILSEGLLDFVLISDECDSDQLTRLLYLMQATRSRIWITDYITCPSCGRTLFDIETTTQEVKKYTSHLKGLKIGIMGCIVNGPGEMADADFGYVGSGPGKIDLYYGQERVCRNIDQKDALARLIQLIKEKGCWVPPAMNDSIG